MNYRRFWVAAAIIAFIIVVGFILSVPHTRDMLTVSTQQAVVTTVPSVAVRDTFKKGVHTITGSLIAPNACAALTVQATFLDTASSSERILVALSLPSDDGVCLQLPTAMNFSTTVVAPANLPIVVTVNGSSASTTAL